LLLKIELCNKKSWQRIHGQDPKENQAQDTNVVVVGGGGGGEGGGTRRRRRRTRREGDTVSSTIAMTKKIASVQPRGAD
jgi:hypothetical protein